jgi:5-amino-6-(5-phosphoribosylamino)uracil reductase
MRRLVPRAIDRHEVEESYDDIAGRRADGRPYVVVNMVASADGAISVEGRTEAMSSEADRFVFHHLRSLADVILVGAQTVRAERYGPPKINDERQAARRARGQAPVPRIAIVSASLDLDWSSRLFTESPTRPIILTTDDAPAHEVAAARAVADVVVAGTRRVDLPAALAQLDAGVVLCEGGPTLNGVLAAGDLIDELCLTVAPTLVGGDVGTGLLGHARIPELLPVELVHALEEEGDLFLRYRRSSARRVREVGAADVLGPVDGPEVDAFESVVGDLEYPMMIVTAGAAEQRSGCLVGFAAQCSIDPPRFMVWLSKKNHTYRVATSAEVLTVHFPSGAQFALAERFGSQTGDQVDKFEGLDWHVEANGGVVLDDVARWFVGRITETLDSGDHVAFMLRPLGGSATPWDGQLGFQTAKRITPGHEA